MKLNEITNTRRDEIIEWFIANNIEINTNVINREFFEREGQDRTDGGFRDKLLLSIDESITNNSWVIDFTHMYIIFPKQLTSPPPFEFGQVGSLSSYTVDNLKLLDLSKLKIQLFLVFYLDDQMVDIREIAKLCTMMNHVESVQIHTFLGSITNVISGITALLSAHINELQLGFSQKTTTRDDDLALTILINTKYDNPICVNGPKGNVRFPNVMDCQEWMFDNGFEAMI